jgi:2-polyprenyl-6-methoxyphenol hydroxylase-like FAD-dependent oxidoreductase
MRQGPLETCDLKNLRASGGFVPSGPPYHPAETEVFGLSHTCRHYGRARLVGTIRREPEREDEKLSWDDVSKHVIDWMRIDVRKVNWFSTYHVHHHVANQFRKGRTFLLGDSAHIHSPVGGQGMNTGIGDAVNLAWKLAAVLGGRATEALLDSYGPERIGFARRLVATTDRAAFTFITSTGPMARQIRRNVAPFAVPALFEIKAFCRFAFRSTSQTAITYRGGPLAGARR